MRFGVVGLDGNGFALCSNCVIELALIAQHEAKVTEEKMIVGALPQSLTD